MRRASVVALVVAVVAAVVVVGASAAAVDGARPAASADLDGSSGYSADDGLQDAGDGLQDADDAEQPDGPNRSEQRAAVASGERLVEPCAASSPADHEPPAESGSSDDAIGWEAGYWYDEPVAVENNESLTEGELEAVVARTAARVEALRCLEFESVPPVELVNRSEMADRQTRALTNRSQATVRFDDARLEAALVAGTEVDPSDARISTRSAAVQAVYDPATGRVALLSPDGNATETDGETRGNATRGDEEARDDGSGGSDDATAFDGDVRVDEVTLAHELTHALQDQAFNLSRFDARQTDVALAESGLIEGDAVLVERRYEQRCGDGGWNQSCLAATPPDGDGDPNVPLNLLLYQPYNDGPGFASQAYDAGGWSAVDERYEQPPRSSYEVLYPSDAEGFTVANVSVNDSTRGGWERIRPADAPGHDIVGPGAIAATLLAPTFEGVHDPIYDPESIQRSARQTTSDRRYDYRLDAVEGWRGDRLVAFENEGGQTGTIWRSEWATTDDAEAFRARYAELLDIRGAAAAPRYQGTYRFADHSDYDGVAYVRRQGSEVLVVHGPDVAALRSLHGGAAPPFEGGFFSAVRPGAGDVALDELSGVTALTALLAVLVAAVGIRTWERRRR